MKKTKLKWMVYKAADCISIMNADDKRRLMMEMARHGCISLNDSENLDRVTEKAKKIADG